jgi:hypothetical protein
MCGRDIFWIMWELPAAVAYQIFYFSCQTQGTVLISGPSEQELLEEMRQWQM